MSATAVRQAPGWFASLVQAVCDDCGWRGRVHNLNDEANAWGQLERQVKREADQHTCGGAA